MDRAEPEPITAPRFAIGFGGLPGRTTDCGPDAAVAHIVVGEWDELMCVPLDRWDRAAYEDQWRTALGALVDGSADRHALLTAVHDPATAVLLGWWPVWRRGDQVLLGNGLAHEDAHDLAALLDDPGPHVPDLEEWMRPDGDGAPAPSRWSVAVSAVAAFLAAGGA